MAHDKVCPPSGAYRWLPCPGSALPISMLPDRDNASAEYGNIGHAIMHAYGRWLLYGDDMVPVPDTHREAIDTCVTILTDIGLGEREDKDDVLLEYKVPLDDIGITDGTADLVWWRSAAREVHIVDYKFGRGFVDITTPQLPIYGIGCKQMFPQATKFVVHIVAPLFFPHHQQLEYSPAEIDEYARHVSQAVIEAHKPGAARHAGEWCRYCPLMDDCPEQDSTRADVVQVQPASITGRLAAMTPDQQRDWLRKFDAVEAWLKDTWSAVEREILAGNLTMAGCTVGQGRRSQKWIDEMEAARQLGPQVMTIMTPAQAAEVVDKQFLTPLVQWVDGKPTVKRTTK